MFDSVGMDGEAETELAKREERVARLPLVPLARLRNGTRAARPTPKTCGRRWCTTGPCSMIFSRCRPRPAREPPTPWRCTHEPGPTR